MFITSASGLTNDEQSYGTGQRHSGSDGPMGTPASLARHSGLLAIKGPKGSTEGAMLSAYAGGVRSVSTSKPTSHGYGRGGLSIGGRAASPSPKLRSPHKSKRKKKRALRRPPFSKERQEWFRTVVDSKSTFSVDVDTASYNLSRASLHDGHLPNPSEVRIEEFLNYFDYSYPDPSPDKTLQIYTETGPCPWNKASQLLHVGVQAKTVAAEAAPPRNLVFLIDTSGSMQSPDRLPLLKRSIRPLVAKLRPEDHLAIVSYSNTAQVVLEATSGEEKGKILWAIDSIRAGGGTNGSEGIHLAYKLASKNKNNNSNNRVILATDGEFNEGVQGEEALIRLITQKRESGIYLSVLGFGLNESADAQMEALADSGNGNYVAIDSYLEARKVLDWEFSSMMDVIADDVKVQVHFDPKMVKKYRLVGYENRRLAHADFRNSKKDAGEVGSGGQVTALYEVIPERGKQLPQEVFGQIQLHYRDTASKTQKEEQVDLLFQKAALENTSDEFRLAASAAIFAEQLSKPRKKLYRLEQAYRLADGARGVDPHCLRAGFLSLIHQTIELRGTNEDLDLHFRHPECVVEETDLPLPEPRPPARATYERPPTPIQTAKADKVNASDGPEKNFLNTLGIFAVAKNILHQLHLLVLMVPLWLNFALGVMSLFLAILFRER